MRKIVLSMVLLLLMTAPVFAGFVYYNGKVTKISDTAVTVENTTYWIGDKCHISIQYSEKGIFHEKPGALKDIKPGDWVTVRTDGRYVTEILIEQYRK